MNKVITSKATLKAVFRAATLIIAVAAIFLLPALIGGVLTKSAAATPSAQAAPETTAASVAESVDFATSTASIKYYAGTNTYVYEQTVTLTDGAGTLGAAANPSISNLSQYVPTGGSFVGWGLSNTLATLVTGSTVITGDTRLYAKYMVYPSSKIEKPGYTFKGWFLDEALSVPYNTTPLNIYDVLYPSYELIGATPPVLTSAKLRYYPGTAVYYERTVTLTNGSYTLTSDDYKASPTPGKNIYSEQGFAFKGWGLANTATACVDSNTVITEDTNLYAKTYVSFAPTMEGYLSKWYFDEALTIPCPLGTVLNMGEIVYHSFELPLPPDPVKEGYTFVGWYLDEALNIPYTGQAITSNTTLYAKFVINTYTVTFNTNGGTSISSQTVDYDTAPVLYATTKPQHTFSGWFTNAGLTTEYIPGTGIKADTTLYAAWDRSEVLGTVNFAGGSYTDEGGTLSGVIVEYAVIGESLADFFTNLIPVRPNYTFAGWLLDGSLLTIDSVVPGADFNLTAQWNVKRYTVTFVVDGQTYFTVEVDHGTTFETLKSIVEPTVQAAGYGTYSLSYADGLALTDEGEIAGNVVVEVPADETDTTDPSDPADPELGLGDKIWKAVTEWSKSTTGIIVYASIGGVLLLFIAYAIGKRRG